MLMYCRHRPRHFVLHPMSVTNNPVQRNGSTDQRRCQMEDGDGSATAPGGWGVQSMGWHKE
jgi:hypothetical protein